ncbi:trypsin-like cysteine/serine peptidase domain-containing protein [Tribonema minus]|uniref:Trypsin-like cysteine/serine peptidase domain-containing protein n=1 Tax=Tribonema minus TaxID=303371 RepID=A0A835Z574_9STRA|nr:trypsin-like cysteine/serine peptidase domain-containing protein [Tribonema minus]
MPFGPFDGGGGGGGAGKVEQGQGSGVIFSADGLVLTNAHVVNGANKVTVTLTDGRKLLATVKGADELTDLAVLKIEGEGENIPFPVAQLGDSEELSVGDWVIAVGNPVGLDSTVTLGIVSSLKRSSQEVGIPDRKVTFIQTDAAINPGNSGGALVNERGEVVGINTAIRAYAEGIGFAIPVNKAKQIMYELAEGRAIQHPYIGVHMTTVTPDMARQNNLDPNAPNELPEVYGAMVIMVLPSTPAYDAGLRRFDVVIEMKGARIKNAGDIVSQVDECMVGENVPLKVLRAGRVMDLSIRPRDVLEMRQRQQLQQQQQRQQQQQQQGGGWLPFPGESQMPPGGSGGPPNTPPPGRGGGGNSSPHRTPGRRFGGGGLPGLPGFPGLP